MKNISPGLGAMLARRALLGLIGVSSLWGCAPWPPIPFDLIERGQVYHGTMSPSERQVAVSIGGKQFQGYYLVATGTAYFQGGWHRRPYPFDMRTNFVSNSARATMVAADGERLTCEFIVEDASAIGECRSTNGSSYQLVTQVR